LQKKLKILLNSPIITGTYCEFHHVNIEDSKLIYDLRRKRPEYLRKTSGGLKDQKKYLEKYFHSFARGEQIYYKVFDKKKGSFKGVFRLTNLKGINNFSWESAVFNKDSSPNCFLDTMLMTYRIGFEFLEKRECGPWNVMRNFHRMMEMHSKMKMVQILEENELHFVVSVKSNDYFQNIKKYKKLGFAKLLELL